MGADKEVISKLTLQGDSTGMVSAMQKVEAQIKTFDGNIANVSGTLGKLTGIVGGITAVLAGGAMFKEVVGETNKWTGEAMKLSKMLGITTEEASVLNLALGDVYLSMDTMTSASMALNKNTLKNTEVFSHYGIALKDSNGHQRNTLEIMNDVNAKLLTIKEGRDRELAGLQLYGKGWADARGMLKLTADVMEEAKRKAEELHLVIGPEAVANTKAYKAAMNDVEDIWMAMKIQVGNQLIPVLTRLGVWFNDIGPVALEIFIGALKGVVTFGQYAALGLIVLYETAKAGVNQIITLAMTTGSVLEKVLAGDFKGAAEAAKTGWRDMASEGDKWADSIIAATKRTNDSVGKMWGFTATKPPKSKAETADQRVDPYDKGGTDVTASLIAAESARLTALLTALKAREAAEKEYETTSSLEWDFFYRTGMMTESEYQSKKYEINKTALVNTRALLDEELKDLEDSLHKKLTLETDATKRSKLTDEAKTERTNKLAERSKLNDELYRLDVRYQTDSQVLRTQKALDESSSLHHWAAVRAQSIKDDLDMSADFEARKAEARGDSYQRQLLDLERERQALEYSWAMNANTYEEYERRKAAIDLYYETEKTRIKQGETSKQLQLAAGGFNSISSIADSFYQLSKGKNKAAFKVYQVTKSGETVISTADAAMKAYSAMAGIPFVGPALGVAAAAAAVAAGAVQLQTIWGSSADGGGALANVSGGSASPASSSPVTQPVNYATSPGGITVNMNFDGTTLVDQQALTRWSEDILIPSLRDLKTRGIQA